MLTLVGPNDPVLRTRTPQFDFVNPAIDPKAFTHDLADLMYRKRGLGLAAPQVGQSLRVFVMVTGSGWAACFNPVVMKGDHREMNPEECLSFPGLKVPMFRARQILCRWQDHTGKEHMARFEGLTARCFQHELDHLEGLVLARPERAAVNKTMAAAQQALAMKRARKPSHRRMH